MAITAKNSGTTREPIPAGIYIARCFQMIEIGTVEDTFNGAKKQLYKVRIGWELPTEKKVFKEDRGEEPLVISKEYTLSLNEKSTLRKDLKSWRGKDFSDEEAEAFDITKLLGVPCMLNIIHKPPKDGKVYDEISSITPVLKGVTVPPQINKTKVLSYDAWNQELFDSLPDFIKQKIQNAPEYAAMKNPNDHSMNNPGIPEGGGVIDDLPF